MTEISWIYEVPEHRGAYMAVVGNPPASLKINTLLVQGEKKWLILGVEKPHTGSLGFVPPTKEVIIRLRATETAAVDGIPVAPEFGEFTLEERVEGESDGS